MSFAAEKTRAVEAAVGSRIEQYVDVALKGRSKNDFNRFKEFEGGFGSFFVSTDGKYTAWSARSFTKSDADTLGRVLCEAKSGSNCVLYARWLPKNAVRSVGLPERKWRDWQRAQENVTDERHVALAINAWSVFAISRPQETKAGATTDALDLCGRAIKRFRRQLNPELFERSLEAGLFDCRAVAVK
ncbi:MAG: hypothetical protein AAGF36_12415 [Pseudomonadota bacterium]